MSESYSIRIAQAEHVFSAAHFITYAGECEPLHGHNYHMAVEVGGPLGDDHLVIDFLALRAAVADLCRELDHAVLLPTESAEIRVVAEEDSVTATFKERRWTFPRGDCRLLPVANTTSESLAAHLGHRLQNVLSEQFGLDRAPLKVELQECHGQRAIWRHVPA